MGLLGPPMTACPHPGVPGWVHTGEASEKGHQKMGIGVSIFLMAVGAILTFAVDLPRNNSGLDLNAVGVILMVFGLVGLLASFVVWNDWMPRRRRVDYIDHDPDVIVRRRRHHVLDLDEPAVVRRTTDQGDYYEVR
jgi:hypothetical protein